MGIELAFIIIITFALCLFAGIPVMFSICIPAIIVMLIRDFELMVVPQMLSAGVQSFTLLAVPFFILAGNIMNNGGITKRIFDFCLALVGHIRGSLGHVIIVAEMIFSGISGSAAADAAGIGMIGNKAMVSEGYDKDFGAAIVASSSVLGPIIPPSIIMVIYAIEANVSIAALFIAGIIPGIIIGLGLMGVIYFLVITGREKVPERKRATGSEIIGYLRRGFLAVMAPLIILAGMFSGGITPTEAGILATIYCAIVSAIYGEFEIKQLPKIFMNSAIETAQVMFMFAAASVLGWVVTSTRIPVLASNAVLSITTNKYLFLLIVNIFLLFLGCLIESIAGMLIVLPIFLPIAASMGIDLVHFGVIVTYAMSIGLITPPMGAGLFIVCGVTETKFDRVVRKVVPFIIVHVLALLLITYMPVLSLWLPSFMRL